MRVIFAADHAGFPLKETLKPFVKSLGYEIEDVGAFELDMADDYIPFVRAAAEKVSQNPQNTKAIVIGASGMGEAMVANRFKGVRCALFYGLPLKNAYQIDATGKTLDIVASTREHNDANALSLGARFLSEEDAKNAVKEWLATPFSGAERHARRIRLIDEA